MKDYEDLPPIIIEKGKGVWLYDTEGKAYLDAVSSWWVNLFGHSHPRLNKVLSDQAGKLEHVIFANFSHRPAIELAERLLALAPPGLEKIFFADNGSSAVEASLKMAFQYQLQTGQKGRTRFMALTDAYHGETLGALSVGGLDLYGSIYQPLLTECVRVTGPDCYRCPYGLNRSTCSAECFVSVEKAFDTDGHSTAAFIVEPLLQAAAGMKMYPPVWLKKLRAICDRWNVLLVADEIATGFGRTGTMFASEQAGISPDIMCLSKGITAGYMPLSAVLCTDRIYDAFYADYCESKAFLHSHSYTGNALACAVACASLDIFKDENILDSNRKKSELMNKLVSEKADRPNLGEVRHLGMVLAIELVKDRATKEPFDWKERVGYKIYKKALSKGVILRPLGNVLYFMPPYVISDEEIWIMVDYAFKAIEDCFAPASPV
jgi:adenosylmethionine---8-amino-7-oxononanoate aminotransferase